MSITWQMFLPLLGEIIGAMIGAREHKRYLQEKQKHQKNQKNRK